PRCDGLIAGENRADQTSAPAPRERNRLIDISIGYDGADRSERLDRVNRTRRTRISTAEQSERNECASIRVCAFERALCTCARDDPCLLFELAELPQDLPTLGERGERPHSDGLE